MEYIDKIPDLVEIYITYLSGWNLVGLPLEVEDSSYEILFPESVDGTLYSFTTGYVLEIELLVGMGYWLRFSGDGISTITGLSVDNMEINLLEGWNLISGITELVDVNNIIDPSGIIIQDTFYGFGNGYENVDVLVPSEGYWVRTSGAGAITLQ